MNWNITAGRPVYVQLVEQLELALVAGEFPPGSRIPPVRELAADAGVNPNTMQRALQELESRGLLQAQRTAGVNLLPVGDIHKLYSMRLNVLQIKELFLLRPQEMNLQTMIQLRPIQQVTKFQTSFRLLL
jgi:DNA-binding transcriptional regulator YhcF (GntR family)